MAGFPHPAVELKAKIDAFLAERKGSKTTALDKECEDIFNVDESAPMDI
jgi:hypothetical protein